MPLTGISTSAVSTVPVTDFPLGSSTLDTTAAGPEQDKRKQTENRNPSHVVCTHYCCRMARLAKI